MLQIVVPGPRTQVLVVPLMIVFGGDAAPADEPSDLAEAVLRSAAEDAVRDYAAPARLAENPLATGVTAAGRAASVRALVDDAVQSAFGTAREDLLLLEVLRAGYLVASTAHEDTADSLFLSRSTYFRRLRISLRRTADQLVADAGSALQRPRELAA